MPTKVVADSFLGPALGQFLFEQKDILTIKLGDVDYLSQGGKRVVWYVIMFAGSASPLRPSLTSLRCPLRSLTRRGSTRLKTASRIRLKSTLLPTRIWFHRREGQLIGPHISYKYWWRSSSWLPEDGSSLTILNTRPSLLGKPVPSVSPYVEQGWEESVKMQKKLLGWLVKLK